MWLLDVNVPIQIIPFLEQQGIKVGRSDAVGWTHLQNGNLVREASKNGFTCLLTRDKLFGESAAKALSVHKEFAVVLLTVSQTSGKKYAEQFAANYTKNPLIPKKGAVIKWP